MSEPKAEQTLSKYVSYLYVYCATVDFGSRATAIELLNRCYEFDNTCITQLIPE